MPANPWELRADVRPLDLAAQRWTELGALLTSRGDELVAVARRATEGWDAAAAESYEEHRRQVLANLDRFTDLTTEIAGSLRAVSAVLTSSQKELDRAWTNVAMVPHDVVGESRHLVFHPSEDDDRGKVTRGQAETEEIRRRLTLSLDQEGTRLRSARAELAMVRSELTTLTGGAFPGGLPESTTTGVGAVAVAPASTSVPGSAQSGVAALPPIGSISVSMPDLTGLSPAGLAPLAATAASGIARRGAARASTSGVPPMGGMSAGGMGVRGGTMSRGMDSGRAGPRRLATPTLTGASDEEAARLAREKEAAKAAEREAKQAALAEKRAERAARRAEREAERADVDLSVEVEDVDEDQDEDQDEDALEAELEDANADAADGSDGAPGDDREGVAEGEGRTRLR